MIPRHPQCLASGVKMKLTYWETTRRGKVWVFLFVCFLILKKQRKQPLSDFEPDGWVIVMVKSLNIENNI